MLPNFPDFRSLGRKDTPCNNFGLADVSWYLRLSINGEVTKPESRRESAATEKADEGVSWGRCWMSGISNNAWSLNWVQRKVISNAICTAASSSSSIS